MRGRVIAGAACLLVSLLLGIAGRCVIADTAGRLTRELDEALSGSGEARAELARGCAAFWEQRRGLLGLFVHHAQTEALDEGFRTLGDCLAAGDPAGTRESLRRLKALSAALAAADSPSWENLLRADVNTM